MSERQLYVAEGTTSQLHVVIEPIPPNLAGCVRLLESPDTIGNGIEVSNQLFVLHMFPFLGKAS